MDLSFLPKTRLASFSLGSLFSRKPESYVGIDIGAFSTKALELKYASGRAILQTYGELRNETYFKTTNARGVGILRYADNDLAQLLKDLMREAHVTAKDVVCSVPATSSFVVAIPFPRLAPRELASAIPLEARKYIPIPLSEVVLEWTILDGGEDRDIVEVLLVAVQREVVEKFKRIATLAGLRLAALEVETFSMVRSLVGHDPIPEAIINIGYQVTTLAIVDRGQLRISHNLDRGAHELTRALERGLGINTERAEALKRDVGISDDLEKREVSSIITPHIDSLFTQMEQLIRVYNRKSSRKIQKINLTGGGANLKGMVEAAASRFGVETAKGNPFARVIAPAFMQMVFREIGPSFSVAIGLALREIASR
ncbi:MAG: type IV pilus assembly protein PilM [bacterium]|nr:type IV pilus assembly protein PilM [bacterium]